MATRFDNNQVAARERASRLGFTNSQMAIAEALDACWDDVYPGVRLVDIVRLTGLPHQTVRMGVAALEARGHVRLIWCNGRIVRVVPMWF